MKYCSHCGKEIHEEAEICVHCGCRVEKNRSALLHLKTDRTLVKYIFLSILTFGIYGLVQMSGVSTDINIVASPHDGKKTMHFCLMFFVMTWLTLGIAPLVWYNNISERIGRELQRRGISYEFGARTYWLWNILGSMIMVGPFIYYHRLFKSMNLIAEDYNLHG